MNNLQQRRYSMFQRVGVFARQYAPLFPAGSIPHEHLARLAAGLEELEGLSVEQLAGERDVTLQSEAKAGARTALLADLRRIIKTAQFIADTVPGFDEPFKLPRSESDAALLYTAKQFAERATPSLDIFIRFSMPAEFIQDLTTHIRDIEHASGNRAIVRKRQKSATAAIDAVMKMCMKTVRNFDVIVANMLRDDPATTAVWKSARHVQRARTSKADSASASVK